MKIAGTLSLTVGLLLLAGAAQARHASSIPVRQQIINESIRSHGGYCVCPYQKTHKGKLCGSRSLYSQPGGYPPQCFARDIDDESVEAWLGEHGGKGR